MGVRKLEPMVMIEDLDNDRDLLLKTLEDLEDQVAPIDTHIKEEPTLSPANEEQSNAFADRFEQFFAQQVQKDADKNFKSQNPLTRKVVRLYQYQNDFELSVLSKGQNLKKFT